MNAIPRDCSDLTPGGNKTSTIAYLLKGVREYLEPDGKWKMKNVRRINEHRLAHLLKIQETHIEIDLGGTYCLVFRNPELPPDNEVCKWCKKQDYLEFARAATPPANKDKS